MSVKANVLANYLGQMWRAAMSLAFIPLYIRYMGIEAYGLIGVFAMLQAWLVLLDMGMRPTLSREMARYTAGAHSLQSIWNLVRSVEIIAALGAVLIAAGIWMGSKWLAASWLKANAIPIAVVARSLALMGVVMGLRFIEGVYSSTVIGLQRQVLDNAITVSTSTLRGVGAIGILAYVSPTIEAFFAWQCAVSMITVMFYGVAVHRLLPAAPQPARFSMRSVTDIWRFAMGMTLISFLALLLTQVDKILLSRMLTLKAFGYYALAGTVANALYLTIAPITTAFYPRFTELATSDDTHALSTVYHQAAQLVTVLMGGSALVLALFAEPIVFLWSGDPILTRQAAALLPVLAIGTLFNGLMWIPYQLQLAYGWTSLTVRINLATVAILVPAILWFVPEYGAIAAAWIWMVLNAGYLIFVILFMHRRLLTTEKWKWYRDDLAKPLAASLFVGLLCRWAMPAALGKVPAIGALLCSAVAVMTAGVVFAPLLRHRVMEHWPQRLQPN